MLFFLQILSNTRYFFVNAKKNVLLDNKRSTHTSGTRRDFISDILIVD